ncbi:MAG: DUF3047 domain-containing protein [Planctomycetota bacterium]
MKRLLAALLLIGLAQAADEARLGFSGPLEDGLPAGWKHVPFPSISKTTSYAVVASGDALVLRANARSSASIVVRRVTDTGDRLHWRWRVDRTILAGDGATKATDDFPARVWVGFEGDWSEEGWTYRRTGDKLKTAYGFTPPTHWIHYVWTGRGRAKGDAFDEPYDGAHFKCIALRTDKDALGDWFDEERDPRADFKQLFGRDPGKIIAIAVMTDGDDTGSEATASYADIGWLTSSAR